VPRNALLCGFVVPVLLVTCTGLSQASQADSSQPTSTVLHVRLGPTWPLKKTFRESWDQTFILSSIKAPISVFAALEFPQGRRGALTLELGRTSYVMEDGSIEVRYVGDETESSPTLAIQSLLAGYRYHFNDGGAGHSWLPYVGGGLSFYWALLGVTYIVVGDVGNTVAYDETTEHHFGPGAFGCLGLSRRLSSSVTAGLELKADVNFLGQPDSGGLGQIGGLSVLLDLGFGL
jgi:hypothetical protein